MRIRYYTLDDGRPVIAHNLLAWAAWFERADRVIATDTISQGIAVSTVFMGVDHQLGHGPPLLYETVVSGGPLDAECSRYSTREEAQDGHAQMVALVRECSNTS